MGRFSSIERRFYFEFANFSSFSAAITRIRDDAEIRYRAGTGAVTFTLASRFPSVPILATDISAPMLSNISSAQLSSVSTRVADALSLSQELAPRWVFPYPSFSHRHGFLRIEAR